MSYIHEALRKAQETKTRRISAGDADRREPTGRDSEKRKISLMISAVVFFLLFLAGAGFYIWNSGKTPVFPLPQPPGNGRTSQEGKAVLPEKPPLPPVSGEAESSPSVKADDLYEKALWAQKSGDFREAEALYRRILASSPPSADGLNNLGVLLMARGELEEAEKMFGKAVEADGAKADPYYNMACLCSLQQRIGEGLQYLGKAVSIKKDVKSWAKDDKDLENLRRDDNFQRIMGE